MDIIRKPDKKEFTTVYAKKSGFDVVREAVDPVEYDKYREMWKRSASLLEVPDFPIQIDFELNDSCNYSCPMCTYSAEAIKDKGRKNWFDFGVFKEIISEGVKRGLKAVRLNYVNEPLIRRDIKKFISYARESGILDIYFSTNGFLLTERASRELIEAGLLRLQVSIDAATKETYDKIRPGGDFHKVLNNIHKFLQIRNEMGSELPTLRINYVKTELNAHELPMFVEYWEDKADAIGIQDFINIGNLSPDKPAENKPVEFKCNQPFCHLTIRSNGEILPCCAFYGARMPLAKVKVFDSVNSSTVNSIGSADKTKHGKLKDMTVEDAWMSKELVTLREIHKNGEYWKNPVCRQCVTSTSR